MIVAWQAPVGDRPAVFPGQEAGADALECLLQELHFTPAGSSEG